jgi:hypothetical protein
VPYLISVDGDHMLLVEGVSSGSSIDGEEPPDAGETRAQILDATGWTPVPRASPTRVPMAIAGPYVAVSAYGPRRIELADLATGTTIRTITGDPGFGADVDLTPDGRIAAGMTSGIELASPTEPQRNLPNSGRLVQPRWAAGTVTAFDDEHDTLNVFRAGERQEQLGPRSLIRTAIDGDEQGVAWAFNGCVRYAPLAAPATGKRNACPTTEIALYGIPGPSKLRHGQARSPVRCVAGPRGRCRGTLIAKLDYGKPIVGRGRFSLPVSEKYVNVSIHFDAATIARFKREKFGSLIVNAQIPNGTVSSGADWSSELGVEVDDRS